MVQEVLDGSVHVRRDVGTFDLTHGQTKAPAHHCRYPGNHRLNTGSAPAGGGFRSQSWCGSVLTASARVGRRSEGSAPARRLFIRGGSEQHRLRVEREAGDEGVKTVVGLFPLKHQSSQKWVRGPAHARQPASVHAAFSRGRLVAPGDAKNPRERGAPFIKAFRNVPLAPEG